MRTKNPFTSIIRWTARITGSLLIALTVLFGIANFIDGLGRNNGGPLSSFSTLIIIVFIIWGFALAGLVIALWREGLGGWISLASFIIMYILTMVNPLAPDKGIRVMIIFLIFMLPSLLYICYWWLAKNISPKTENIEPENQ